MSGAADEHDYIEHLIVARWWGQAERKIFPLRDDARACLFSGRLGEALILEVREAQMAQQMINEKTDALGRLRWIELDAALRGEGRNYLDVCEAVPVQCNSQDFQE